MYVYVYIYIYIYIYIYKTPFNSAFVVYKIFENIYIIIYTYLCILYAYTHIYTREYIHTYSAYVPGSSELPKKLKYFF